ncbi:hypothetical protein [Streptomyces sp. NPDC001435]|uniref:hypothetical protein n=1 Tax=Streptomyces sp. NPDC001435 TaxID=3364576 RepID=UPI0036795B40
MPDIRIDTSGLVIRSFFIPGRSSEFLDGSTNPTVSLDPGAYGLVQLPGQAPSFQFEVTQEGLVEYGQENDLFLDGRGTRTLTLRGVGVTLDGRSLSHDLLLLRTGLAPFSRNSIHDLALMPAAGYGFHSVAGTAADFRFDVGVDGAIVVDARFDGFARVSGRRLTIDGFPVSVDGSGLSHGLVLLNVFGGGTVNPSLFASTLHVLLLRLIEVNRAAETEGPTQEYIAALRELAGAPGADVRLLVQELLSMSAKLAEAERPEEAFTMTQAAADIQRVH